MGQRDIYRLSSLNDKEISQDMVSIVYVKEENVCIIYSYCNVYYIPWLHNMVSLYEYNVMHTEWRIQICIFYDHY